jgi:hypothetical protein
MYYYNLTYTGRQLYCLPRQVPRESNLSTVDNLMFTSYEDNKNNSGIADIITKPDWRKNDVWYNSMFTLWRQWILTEWRYRVLESTSSSFYKIDANDAVNTKRTTKATLTRYNSIYLARTKKLTLIHI